LARQTVAAVELERQAVPARLVAESNTEPVEVLPMVQRGLATKESRESASRVAASDTAAAEVLPTVQRGLAQRELPAPLDLGLAG